MSTHKALEGAKATPRPQYISSSWPALGGGLLRGSPQGCEVSPEPWRCGGKGRRNPELVRPTEQRGKQGLCVPARYSAPVPDPVQAQSNVGIEGLHSFPFLQQSLINSTWDGHPTPTPSAPSLGRARLAEWRSRPRQSGHGEAYNAGLKPPAGCPPATMMG